MSPGPQPSTVGSQTMNSLVPMTGSTLSGSTVTPCRLASQPAAAARSAGVPAVAGYPGESAAPVSASMMIGGTGSTGVPTDKSTMPPG